jgi:dolichyl-phosphate beta-glucosyltransferase
MTRPELALIVPCYNEALRLVPKAFADFAEAHRSVLLLLVDDGSTDATFQILDRVRQSSPATVDIIRLPARQGKAEAVRAGILEGMRREAEFVGFWDADLSTPLCAVDHFLELAAKRPEIDVILGSRVMLMGRDIRRKAWRHYLGRVFATAVSLALDLPVYDTQCGAKVIRVNPATRTLFAERFGSRWIFDVELLARYLAQADAAGGVPRRSRIYELALPVWHHKPGSRLRIADFVRAVLELAAIWRARARASRLTHRPVLPAPGPPR